VMTITGEVLTGEEWRSGTANIGDIFFDEETTDAIIIWADNTSMILELGNGVRMVLRKPKAGTSIADGAADTTQYGKVAGAVDDKIDDAAEQAARNANRGRAGAGEGGCFVAGTGIVVAGESTAQTAALLLGSIGIAGAFVLSRKPKTADEKKKRKTNGPNDRVNDELDLIEDWEETIDSSGTIHFLSSPMAKPVNRVFPERPFVEPSDRVILASTESGSDFTLPAGLDAPDWTTPSSFASPTESETAAMTLTRPVETLVSKPATVAKPRISASRAVETQTAISEARLDKAKPASSWLRTASVFLLAAVSFGLIGFGLTEPENWTIRIADVEVGQALPWNENPEEEEDTSLGDMIDPPNWRKITLQAPKTDGSVADVELLRPVWWLEAHRAAVGKTVHISVPECGIDGDARVLSVVPCPEISNRDDMRIVTGKFVHRSTKTYDLHVEGLDEPIGTTGNHPFWSEDEQNFVRADSLQPGDRLRTLRGLAQITAIVPRAGPEPVFNLEVAGSHVYHVASSGVLVHNGGSGLPIAAGNNCFIPKDGYVPTDNPSRVYFEGTEVRAVRDLSHVDESTLREMADKGFAAKDVNGNPIVLHHHNQNPAGPIIEMPRSRHNVHNSIQHPFGNTPGAGLTKQQRDAFNDWREDYWRARALDELNKRGLEP
jgi:hypothetical protein